MRSSTAFAAGDAFLKWKGKSRLEWAWHSFNLVTTVTYLDGYHEFVPFFESEHWVSQTWTFDLQASYTFQRSGTSTAGRAPTDGKENIGAMSSVSHGSSACWQRLLRDTTVTVGCNNLFDRDPPRAYHYNQAGYPDYLYDLVGRFVYVKPTKRF